MRSKKIFSVLGAIVFSAFMMGVAVAGSGPETIVLKNKKGDVNFPHHAHQARMQCAQCHHGEKDGKLVPYAEGMKIEPCLSCHNKDFPNKKLDNAMKTFHTNCKDCHKAHNAPTSCNTCHAKK